MRDRIKILRKTLGLNQTEFGNRLGMSRWAIVNIELDRAPIKPLLIDLICSTFGANKEWLVSGTGPMLADHSRDDQIMDFVASAMSGESDNFKRRLLSVLARLDEDHWELLEHYLRELVAPPESPTDSTEDGP